MDKRHPSSFQQLEKLGEGTYATVRVAPPRPHALQGSPRVDADEVAGLQRPQWADGPVRGSERNPSGQRGGDT